MQIQGFPCMMLTFSQQTQPNQSPPAMRLRLWRGWYAFPRAVGFIEDSNSKLYNALIHPKTFKVVE
jgi:hypothetical protein